jgi:hypothetical protein
MAICLMLRFLHAVLTGDASKFGPFKLRGVKMQFVAAIGLYRLFAEHAGEDIIPEDKLHWAMHNLLVTLLQPQGLGSRMVDCPTDQTLFLWTLLPNGQWRIPVHLQSLLAGFKFGFRCTAIHLARIEAHRQQSYELVAFYDSFLEDEKDVSDQGNFMAQQASDTANNKLDIPTILNKLKNLMPFGESTHSLVCIDSK